jgi:hypothetical protein
MHNFVVDSLRTAMLWTISEAKILNDECKYDNYQWQFGVVHKSMYQLVSLPNNKIDYGQARYINCSETPHVLHDPAEGKQ